MYNQPIVGNNQGEAEISGLKASLYYDSGQTQTYIRGSGLRFFGSADRFVDIDYRNKIYKYIDIDGAWVPDPRSARKNPYTARIVGGVKVDKLTADEVETTGAVLCGGSMDWSGRALKSFGKYKNARGYDIPRAEYDNSKKVFVVYHSIGHTNYVPMLTATAGAWADLPHVVGVNAYSFEIAFINSSNERNQWSFNYTCFKAD